MPANKIADSVCVSIHDVAPATWPNCRRLIEAMRAVADVPLTLLVVPSYHTRDRAPPDAEFVAALDEHRARGDELALHGFFHLDDAPPPRSLRGRLLRRWYTAAEGEFAELNRCNARLRLETGLAWFERRGWRPEGFVAPAWLLGDGAWQALSGLPLRYTTTLRRFYLLPERHPIASPAFACSTRSAWRRTASRLYAAALRQSVAGSPLVRLALHPGDADHPDIVRHWQRLLERLLATRAGTTKAAFAARARGVIADGIESITAASMPHGPRLHPGVEARAAGQGWPVCGFASRSGAATGPGGRPRGRRLT